MGKVRIEICKGSSLENSKASSVIVIESGSYLQDLAKIIKKKLFNNKQKVDLLLYFKNQDYIVKESTSPLFLLEFLRQGDIVIALVNFKIEERLPIPLDLPKLVKKKQHIKQNVVFKPPKIDEVSKHFLTFDEEAMKNKKLLNSVRKIVKDSKDFKQTNNGDFIAFDYRSFKKDKTFSTKLLNELRGLLINRDNGQVIGRRFHKFFNYNERLEDVEVYKDIIVTSQNSALIEKFDGRLCSPLQVGKEILWYTRNKYDKSIQTFYDNCFENAELEQFIKLWQERFTLLFEFVDPKQLLTVPYKEPKLILISARHIESGIYVNYNYLMQSAKEHQIQIATSYSLNYENMSIEEISKKVYALDKNIEGFVLYTKNNAIHSNGYDILIKLKTKWYIENQNSAGGKNKIKKTSNVLKLMNGISIFTLDPDYLVSLLKTCNDDLISYIKVNHTENLEQINLLDALIESNYALKFKQQQGKAHVYIDLDGVLADFDEGLQNLPEFKSSDEMWNRIREKKDFFETLKPIREAVIKLYHYLLHLKESDIISDITILTSIPKGNLGETADKQKKKWCLKYLNTTQVITCDRLEKSKYSSRGKILIDDRKELYETKWNQLQGEFIHHVEVDKTIEKLNFLLGINLKVSKKNKLPKIHSTVTILRGLPGCGKSTLCTRMSKKYQKQFIIASADKYFTRENISFDATKLSKAHEYCYNTFMKALDGKQPIIVDNTNITFKEVNRYAKYCTKNHIDFTIIELSCSNILQALEFNYRCVHQVPVHTSVKMYNRFESNLKFDNYIML